MTQKHDRSRRKFLKLSGCSLVVLPAALVASESLFAQIKASQASVNYQDHPKDAKKCADCQLFMYPGACLVVEGEISPEGWCSLFVLKQGDARG